MTPLVVVPYVFSPKLDIVGGNDDEVHTHQEIGQGEILDVEGMHLILFAEQHPPHQDEQIAETRHQGDDPDGHSEHNTVQQVVHATDAIPSRFTLSNVERARAQTELAEISGSEIGEEYSD